MDEKDGKPIVQVFGDKLSEVLEEFYDSGITNAEIVGVLQMYLHHFLDRVKRDADTLNGRL